MSNAAEKITPRQEVTKPQPNATAAMSETAAIVNMIERASRDDTVNIDKMRELLAMRKEIMAAANEQAFNDAMAKAQGEMRAVAADSNNPQTRSRYASYFALDKAVRPIYTKHGFGLSFNTEDGAPVDHTRVVCYATCAGHTRKYQWDAPSDGKGAKGGDVMTKTHAGGAAMTYAQRYLLKMIFNMAIGEDKDGNGAAAKKETVSDEAAEKMRETIRSLITETKMPLEKFLAWAKAESVTDIPAGDLKEVIASLEQRKLKMGAK